MSNSKCGLMVVSALAMIAFLLAASVVVLVVSVVAA